MLMAMNQACALLVAIGCLLFSEPGSGQFVTALALPVLGASALLYLLGFQGFLLFSFAAYATLSIDPFANNVWHSILLPLLLTLDILLILVWAWSRGYLRANTRRNAGVSGGYSDFSNASGDSSGGNGSCGGDGGGGD